MSDLFGNPGCLVSHAKAHFMGPEKTKQLQVWPEIGFMILFRFFPIREPSF